MEGGWCKPRVPPKIAKIRLRIIRVCRINSVFIRMGRLKSLYDPSLKSSDSSRLCSISGELHVSEMHVSECMSVENYPLCCMPVQVGG